MHLFKKTLGLIAVLSAIPAAYAATARVGMVSQNNATSRGSKPGVAIVTVQQTKQQGSAGTGTSTISPEDLLSNAECIDAYHECIRGEDACGTNFEECTTTELFHSQMPKCANVLRQCSSDGVTILFGTGNLAEISQDTTTYPSNGSDLRDWIEAAAIANRYDTATCVRRYTSCLQKENVCGAEFELCTTDTEFKKQQLFCDSTLARCQDDGKKELFGMNKNGVVDTTYPADNSRLRVLITEGAQLAGQNAVSTCYKVTDQCFLNACTTEPTKCVDSNKAGYIRNACFDTIATNPYCYTTVKNEMPTSAKLRNEDNQEDVYADLYAKRMNAGMNTKIDDLITQYETTTKQKCVDAVKSCAIRVCGRGSGAVCYNKVFVKGSKHINDGVAYTDEIKPACEAIINADTNCQYVFDNDNSKTVASVFDYVFPQYNNGNEIDAIGAVATLNSLLASSYDDVAIAQLKKQCQNIAKSCIQSVCGDDYINCYRNRTDIGATGTYNTSNKDFNDSMNWVGGVLDNNIVIGLCLDTIKNASSCEEQLEMGKEEIITNHTETTYSWDKGIKVSTTSWTTTETTNSTGAESARDLWLNSNIVTGYCTSKTDGCNASVQKACDTVENGCIYDEPVTETGYTYATNQSAKNILSEVLQDVEMQAQQQYNAKLNKEKRMCDASNTGGLVGNSGNDRTFMWAKLKKDVPSDYSISGLSTKDFEESNNLNNSFCRVRITLQSDDKKIQDAMKGKTWANAYFAIGDSFTCGSWIPEKDLKSISDAKAGTVDDDARKRTQRWMGLLGAVGGGVGGYILGQSITEGKALKGLSGLDKTKEVDRGSAATNCVGYVDMYLDYMSKDDTDFSKKSYYVKEAIKEAKTAGVNVTLATEAQKDYECKPNDTKSGCAKNGNKDWIDGRVEAKMTSAMKDLKTSCSDHTADGVQPVDRKTGWITPVVTGVTTIAGGVLAYKATRDIQQSSLDSEQRAAYEEFMNTIGNHISCYIGGDEAGSYGDIITTSIE